MKLYRVMCRDEWDDLRVSGIFRLASGQMEGKWFATTMIDALVWGRRFPGTTTIFYHVVEVDIPPELEAELILMVNLDGVGDAYFMWPEQMDGLKFRLVNPPRGP